MKRKQSPSDINALAKTMQSLVANTYALLLKTQNYHWNLVGENFYSYHLLLDKQYNELFESVDKIAEITRTIGVKVFASFSKYSKLSFIKEGVETLSANQMILDLVESHESMVAFMMKEYDGIKNPVINALFDERLESHAKAAWMLSSHFNKGK